MKQRCWEVGLVILSVILLQGTQAQDPNDESPRLVQVSDSVFRTVHRPGAANSHVIVTDEGLVVVDGTCRGDGNPAWLKQELDRLYDVPVKYVILSHDHEDHI